MEPLLLAVLATFLAGAIRTSVGVGAGIALTASLSLIFDARMTLAIMAFLQIALGISAVAHYWRRWDFPLVQRLVIAAAAGVVLGSWLITILPTEWLKRTLGLGLAAIAALELLRAEVLPKAKLFPVGNGVASGFVSGVAGAMANASGAVLAIYLKRLTLPHEIFLGTLSVVVLAHDLIRLGAYWNFGLLHETALKTALMLLPFVFGGALVGARLRNLLPERALTRLVLSLVMLMGAVLIF
jgi:uncharacterized membrane protein YfcA